MVVGQQVRSSMAMHNILSSGVLAERTKSLRKKLSQTMYIFLLKIHGLHIAEASKPVANLVCKSYNVPCICPHSKMFFTYKQGNTQTPYKRTFCITYNALQSANSPNTAYNQDQKVWKILTTMPLRMAGLPMLMTVFNIGIQATAHGYKLMHPSLR
jgi:hypothetical protein